MKNIKKSVGLFCFKREALINLSKCFKQHNIDNIE